MGILVQSCMVFCKMGANGVGRRLAPLQQNGLPIFAASPINRLRAEVVELVDTLGSGSSTRKGVGVRLSPSAPFFRAASGNRLKRLFILLCLCCIQKQWKATGKKTLGAKLALYGGIAFD